MRFEWNETLHRGIQAAKTRPGRSAGGFGKRAWPTSPDSPLGQLAAESGPARRRPYRATAAGPDEIIDEDSYEPAAETAPAASAEAIVAAAPEPEAAVEAPPEPAARSVLRKPAAASKAPPAPPPVAEAPPAPVAVASDPEADLLDAEAPVEAAAAAPAAAEAEPADYTATRFPPPAQPVAETYAGGAPPAGTSGFTDFGPRAEEAPETAVIARPGEDLIEVLPRMLPVFRDLSSSVDRPFDSMPEVMPPPPLRPILPPELQGEPAKQGFLDRILGRKNTQ